MTYKTILVYLNDERRAGQLLDVAVNIADGFTRIKNGREIGVSALQYAGGIENAYAGAAQAFGDSTSSQCE